MNGKALKGLEDLPRATSKGLSSTSWVAHSSPESTSGTINTTPHRDGCHQPFRKDRKADILGVVTEEEGARERLWDPSKKIGAPLPSSVRVQTVQLALSHEEHPVCDLAGACSGRHHLQRRGAPWGASGWEHSSWRNQCYTGEWVNMKPPGGGGRELCKSRETKRSPPLVCWQNSPRLGEGTQGQDFFLFLQKSVSSLTFTLFFKLCCLDFGTILLLFSFFVRLAGNNLNLGKEVRCRQRSPRTIHRRWKEIHTQGMPPDVCWHLGPESEISRASCPISCSGRRETQGES